MREVKDFEWMRFNSSSMLVPSWQSFCDGCKPVDAVIPPSENCFAPDPESVNPGRFLSRPIAVTSKKMYACECIQFCARAYIPALPIASGEWFRWPCTCIIYAYNYELYWLVCILTLNQCWITLKKHLHTGICVIYKSVSSIGLFHFCALVLKFQALPAHSTKVHVTAVLREIALPGDQECKWT